MRKVGRVYAISLLALTFCISSLSACIKPAGGTGVSASARSNVRETAALTSKNPGEGTADRKTAAATTRSNPGTDAAQSGVQEPDVTPDPGTDPDNGSQDPGTGDPENIDLQGKTVTISVWPAYPSRALLQVKTWLADTMTQRYNFQVAYVTGGQSYTLYHNFTTSFLSGLWFADVIMLTGEQAFPFMVEKNMIHPLDDYINFQYGLYANHFQQNTLWKGKHYGIQDGLIPPQGLMTYNKDLIAAVGQPDPLVLQRQNNWNFEQLQNISLACTSDRNGDGKNDIYGLSIRQEIFARNMLHANNGDYTRLVNDRYEFALDEAVSLETLQFISNLLHYYKVATADSRYDSFIKGKAAFASELFTRTSAMDFACGVVFYPKGPYANDYVNVITQTPFYAFPTNSQIPIRELSAALSQMWAYWNTDNPVYAGFQNHLEEWASNMACNAEDIRTFTEAVSKMRLPAHSNFMEFTAFCEEQVFSKLSSSASIPSIIEMIKPQAQAMLTQYNQ